MRKISVEEAYIIADSLEYGIYHPYGAKINNVKEVLIEGRAGWFLVSPNMFKLEGSEVKPTPTLILAIGGIPKVMNYEN